MSFKKSEEAREGNPLLLVIPICAWAISWPVMKIGVGAVPPIWFGCLRYLAAFLCLSAVVAGKKRLFIPPRQDWSLVLVSGALQMAAFSALTGLALTVIPPGRASILAYSTPLFVVPLAAWRLNELPSRKMLLGVIVGLVGICVVAAPSIRQGSVGEMTGYAMLLCAAALWAFSIVFVRQHRFAASPLELAPWQMLVATLLLLPLAILGEGTFPPLGRTGAMSLLYVGPFATALAYWAIVEAGRQFRASTISMSLMATPILGISISAFSLGEVVSRPLIVGGISIGGGILLATNGSSGQARQRT